MYELHQKIPATTVLVILISFSVYAFADQGYGYGRQGKGMHYEEGGCSGPGGFGRGPCWN